MKSIVLFLTAMSVVFAACSARAIESTPDEMAAARAWMNAAKGVTAPVPFSFVYGGQPAAERVAKWPMTAREENETFTYTWTCPETALQVRLEGILFPDAPAVEWVVYFKNTGSSDTPIIQDIQAFDATFLTPTGDPIIHYAKGGTCCIEDFRPMTRVLNKGGQMRLQPNGGRSSSDFLPFFNVQNLQLESPISVVIGIGWSGEWATDFQREEDGKSMRARCGMALTRLTLHPGEEIRTPRVALVFYKGDSWLRGQNLLRSFILAHHRPKTADGPLEPVTMNGNWGGTSAQAHLANIQAAVAHDLPFEYYWIDAEWFGKGKWHLAAGDWTPKIDLYPQGFKPLSDALHASGRKLLLWFEPERVCEGVPWYSEHREWLLDVPEEKRHRNWGTSQADPDWVQWESSRNQIGENDRLFNLAMPEARAFLTDFISDTITEFGLDCFRHDANIAPLEFWRAADAPDRQGMTEIRWIEGLYAFWDGLLERHPGLIIDNCASGGRRIDLESMSRSTPYWRTDFPGGPTVKQCHTYGISFWAPFNATGAVNPGKNSAYDMRSTWSGSLDVEFLSGAGDPNAEGFNFDQARAALGQYRDVRKYFLGDYYPLTEYSQAEDAWVAWQFHRADLNEGLVQVFRRPRSVCTTGTLALQGLAVDRNYVVTNLDSGESKTLSGKELTETGVEVNLPERPESAVFVYRVQP